MNGCFEKALCHLSSRKRSAPGTLPVLYSEIVMENGLIIFGFFTTCGATTVAPQFVTQVIISGRSNVSPAPWLNRGAPAVSKYHEHVASSLQVL